MVVVSLTPHSADWGKEDLGQTWATMRLPKPAATKQKTKSKQNKNKVIITLLILEALEKFSGLH